MLVDTAISWNYKTYSSDAIEDLIELYFFAVKGMKETKVGNESIKATQVRMIEDFIDLLKAELDKRDGF